MLGSCRIERNESKAWVLYGPMTRETDNSRLPLLSKDSIGWGEGAVRVLSLKITIMFRVSESRYFSESILFCSICL